MDSKNHGTQLLYCRFTILGFIARFCAVVKTIFTMDFDRLPMFRENCKLKSVDICQLFYLDKLKGHHIAFDNLVKGTYKFQALLSGTHWHKVIMSLLSL